MKNILVLIDNSVNSEHLALSAINIALTIRANITLAHALKKDDSGNNDASRTGMSYANEEQGLYGIADNVRQVTQSMKKDDFVPAVSCLLYPGNVIDLLIESTNDQGTDLVLIASHQPGKWESVMFRSRMKDILDHIGCPLLVIPRKFVIDQIDHAIFAIDFSMHYQKALRYFVAFSDRFGAKVMVKNICRLRFPYKRSELDLCEIVNFGLDKNLPPVTYHTIRSSQVKSALLEIIETTNVNLLCLVHRNYGFIQAMFHMSMSTELAGNDSVPIMILPERYSVPQVVEVDDQVLDS